MARPRSSLGDWRRPRPTETAPAPRWRRYLRFPPAAGSIAAGLQRPATDECPDWTDWPWRLLPRHVPRTVGLGRGEIRLGLSNPPLRIVLRLAECKLCLLQLLFEDSHLSPRRRDPCLGGSQGGLRLIVTRLNLTIVEHGDHIAGLHLIALANANLQNAAHDLGRYRRVIAFDSAGQFDDAGRRGRYKEQSPDHNSDDR